MAKRRIMAIALCITMAGAALTGCGSGNDQMVATTSLETSPQNIQGDTPAAPAPAETSQETAEQEPQKETTPAAEASSPKLAAASIEEAVILDQNGIKVTAKALEDNLFGPSITLLLENDSGQNLTFQARNVSVNGYMVSSMFSSDVVSGKKANDSLTISSTDLQKAQISTIADIEFSLHIFNSESWADVIDTDPIRLTTSAAAGYNYTYDDSGDLAYDGNGVRIVVKGLSENDSIFGPGIILYLENSGNKGVTVQTRDVSINGFMVSPMFSCDLPAGKHAINAITFMSSDLESNSIEKISDVELSFHVFDMESWDTIVDTDTVTIHF